MTRAQGVDGSRDGLDAMLVSTDLATVVDALATIRIDLSSVLHAGDLPPKAKERLENAVHLLDGMLSEMTERAHRRGDGPDGEAETAGAGVGLEDFSPRGSEPGG